MNQIYARRFAASILAGLCCLNVQARAEPRPVQASAIGVDLDGGRVSLKAKDIALERVLKAVEARTGARFNIHDPLIGQAPVSLELRGLPLREAIHAILGGYSYFIAELAGTGGLRVTVLAPQSAEPAPVADDSVSTALDPDSGWDFEPPPSL